MMTRKPPRMVAALGLACALLTAACSDGPSLTEPTAVPEFSRNELRSNPHQTRNTSDGWYLNGEFSLDGEVSSDGEWDWELLATSLTWTQRSVSAVIGRNGGTLTLHSISLLTGWQPAHTLSVPPGAVRKATRFVMEVGTNGVIDVHLSATEVSSGKQVTEFRQPLELSLTYAGSSPEDLDKLAIVHVVDGDVVEAVASVVHADQQAVCGEIWHFSRYAIAAE